MSSDLVKIDHSFDFTILNVENTFKNKYIIQNVKSRVRKCSEIVVKSLLIAVQSF